MTATPTPATTLTTTDWCFLALQRTPVVANGAVAPSFQANACSQVNEVLGDVNGVPQRLISSQGSGQVGIQADILALLGETITRADGTTKQTILQALDAILQAAANPAPAPAATV